MSIDQRLRELVGKIETSHLSREEKEDVYASISLGLHAAVWPVLVGHMPEAQLQKLSADSAGVTPEAYAALVRSAVGDPATGDELDSLMQATLSGVEKVLKEKFIIRS